MASTEPKPDANAYWNVNVPFTEQTADCPAFLAPNLLQFKDQDILRTPDSAYHILTWPEVQSYIRSNRLDLFQRVPSDLRRYAAYNYEIKQKFGSIMDYVLVHKLGWDKPVVCQGEKGRYFEVAEDWCIKWNDWPYGIDRRISHLVVWTKFELDEDPDSEMGDLTTQCRKVVQTFVDETFGKVLGSENVIWFKNWRALKSVQAVEHFHVMLYNADRTFLQKITEGDTPMMDKVKAAEALS